MSLAPSETAKGIEHRLLAPCCWTETLDRHQSPLASELRAEVEARVERGETAEAIESDLAGRYGPRILAARSDAQFQSLYVAVALFAALALGVVVVVARRWTRRAPRARAAAAAPPAPGRDALDDRIDAELAEIDG